MSHDSEFSGLFQRGLQGPSLTFAPEVQRTANAILALKSRCQALLLLPI